MDLSLLTSLYRSDAHLPAFQAHVQQVAAALNAAQVQAELLLIANDPTPEEREAIAAMTRELPLTVRPLTTARETLYASWNRGLAAAQGEFFGPWNVDDLRHAPALIEGIERLRAGLDLIDFPFEQIENGQPRRLPAPYDGRVVHPRCGVGPFFLARRSLLNTVGFFDPGFRIAGDFEWCTRPALRSARWGHGAQLGGAFVLHGGNLSGGRSELEWIEFNVALLRREAYALLRPVNPALMCAAWEEWGSAGQIVPAGVAEWLWGIRAERRWRAYERERRANPQVRRLRLALARRGLWPSVEWAVHQRAPGWKGD